MPFCRCCQLEVLTKSPLFDVLRWHGFQHLSQVLTIALVVLWIFQMRLSDLTSIETSLNLVWCWAYFCRDKATDDKLFPCILGTAICFHLIRQGFRPVISWWFVLHNCSCMRTRIRCISSARNVFLTHFEERLISLFYLWYEGQFLFCSVILDVEANRSYRFGNNIFQLLIYLYICQ